MADKNTGIEQFENELDKIFTDFIHATFDTRQKALQAGAEVFKSAIENATPKDTGEMATSWAIKSQYKDRRFVGNTKTVNGGGKVGIPLSNVLEYKEGSPHYGFIRQTFEANESQIFDTIKNKLNGG